MNVVRLILTGILLAGVLHSQVQAGQATKSLTLNIPASQDVSVTKLLLSDDRGGIVAFLTTTNVSSKAVQLDYVPGDTGAAIGNKIVLWSIDGSPLDFTDFGKRVYLDHEEGLNLSSIKIRLLPGESFTQKVRLDKIYRIVHPGTYVLRVTTKDTENPYLVVRSNLMVFRIGLAP